jgi:hypothetical protein
MARLIPLYDSLIYDLMAKSNAKYKKQNELLKEMISKYLSGEYTKDQLIQEFQVIIDEGKNQKKEGLI